MDDSHSFEKQGSRGKARAIIYLFSAPFSFFSIDPMNS